ncbi:ABC transporter permease subunit [Euzebya sp.]|uniref:ABC transporter permease subunit n=1 Tax=Euzebya sp. TaxID=1971409 RepID=UPI003513C864
MSADRPATTRPAGTRPITSWVLSEQRRPLALWTLAVCAVAAMYISFYPSIGGAELDDLVANLPEGVVTALGYDQIGTAAGYLSSTVYGLLGPALLLVFAVQRGSGLVAGEEEAGTLELELTAPVGRGQVLLGRLAAIWIALAGLVTALVVVTLAFVPLLELDVRVGDVVATGAMLLLLVGAVATVTAAAGASTGRKGVAVGVGAGVAVLGFVLDAIGPTVDAGWMTAISPFSWYLAEEPLRNGFDPIGAALLAGLAVAAALVGLARYERRDLMV